MYKYVLIVAIAAALLAAASCNNIKIPGNIAGQLMDENGAPMGLVTVQLVDVQTGQAVQQETADDRGNYFFKKVDPGTYDIKTLWMGNHEYPNDTGEITLNPGKTMTINIIVSKPEN
jgi:hypothetical protein